MRASPGLSSGFGASSYTSCSGPPRLCNRMAFIVISPPDELATLAAAENYQVVFLWLRHVSPPAELCLGCNNFDLDQELWPEELGNNEEHRGRTRVAEETRWHLSVGPYVFGPRQILGDLDHVGDCHAGLLQHADDVFPGQLGLACDVLRKIAARGKAGRAGC